MSLEDLLQGYTWLSYGKKLKNRITKARYSGVIHEDYVKNRKMRLVRGKEGAIEEEAIVEFYLVVDEEDGLIVDAKFLAYGHSSIIAAADVACELVMGKVYLQASRITTDLLDAETKDRKQSEAFPQETYPFLNKVLGALDKACEKCTDIPVNEEYYSPLPSSEVTGDGYPGFEKLSFKERLGIIEKVLDDEIRPYIAMDGGGIQITSYEGNKLIVSYQGACTSCYSATGATLSAIQQLLKAKVDSNLMVEPDLEGLNF